MRVHPRVSAHPHRRLVQGLRKVYRQYAMGFLARQGEQDRA